MELMEGDREISLMIQWLYAPSRVGILPLKILTLGNPGLRRRFDPSQFYNALTERPRILSTRSMLQKETPGPLEYQVAVK